MAENEVIISFFARQTDLLTGIDKQQNALLKLQQEWGNVGRRAATAGNAASDSFTKGAVGMAQMAAGMAGLGSAAAAAMTVINQVKTEMANFRSRQTEAGNSQIALAAAQRKTFVNLGEDAEIKTAGQLTDRIRKIAEEVGVTEQLATEASAAALSARGNRTANQALDAVRDALRIAPDLGPELATTLAGGAMDIGKATGATPKEALGFLKRLQVASRAEDMEKVARYGVPSMIGMMGYGDSPEKAAAMIAAVSQGEVDKEMRRSRTAALQLSHQLGERLPQLPDTESRIEALRKDPALRKKFLEGGMFNVPDLATGRVKPKKFDPAHFEEQAEAVVYGMLGLGKKADLYYGNYRAALKQTIPIKGADAVYDKLVEEVDSLPAVKNAKLGRELDALDDRVKVGNTKEGEMGILRDRLAKLAKSTGSTDLEQRLSAWEFDLSSKSGKSAAADQLRSFAASRQERIFHETYNRLNNEKFFSSDEEAAGYARRGRSAAQSDEVVKQLTRIATLLETREPIKIEGPKGARAIPAAKGLDAGARAAGGRR